MLCMCSFWFFLMFIPIKTFSSCLLTNCVCFLSCFTMVVLIVTVLGAGLLIIIFEDHYWLIPAFILFNVLMSWCLIKELVLKSFLFSFGQSFITNRELRGLNE